jgi:hypothetical protein
VRPYGGFGFAVELLLPGFGLFEFFEDRAGDFLWPVCDLDGAPGDPDEEAGAGLLSRWE